MLQAIDQDDHTHQTVIEYIWIIVITALSTILTYTMHDLTDFISMKPFLASQVIQKFIIIIYEYIKMGTMDEHMEKTTIW
jgi:hypothetical protein